MMNIDMKTERIISNELKLVPYYPSGVALSWYQDKDVVRQVDDIDEVYTQDKLDAMYDYLNKHGDCFYISYQGKLIGDVSLYDKDKIAIVICKEYQNRHIGRECVKEIIRLAKEKHLKSVQAHIYSFNRQSQNMFLSLGFFEDNREQFVYKIR